MAEPDCPLRLLVTDHGGKTSDAAGLAVSIIWEGSYQQVARTLDFALLCSDVDPRLPVVDCPPGCRVQFYRGEGLLFDGYVYERQKDTLSNTVEVFCADRGMFLKRNQAAYKFRGQTPEAITRRVCGDFGIQVGTLAAPGTPVSRNFPGVTLYKIIQTAYTFAAADSGARYMVRFRGTALEVVEKKQGAQTPVLRPGANLISLTATDSADGVVNQVQLLDKNGAAKGAPIRDADSIALYGLFQSTLSEVKGKDSTSEARKLLADNGMEQKITVQTLGNPDLIAGGCVVLQEPVTGLSGLCWIDSDSHIWKEGQYQCKLVLNFRSIMDEQEAGRTETK